MPRLSRSADEGSALVGAVGLMAVGLILSALVLSSVTNAFGMTTSTRAGIQSNAAAESGISAARADLETGDCQPAYDSATAPIFSASVSYSLDQSGTAWSDGCPALGVAAKRMRIVSTGRAVLTGVAGATSGDTSIVEAVFNYTPAEVPGVPPTGVGAYLAGGVVFGKNGSLETGDEFQDTIDQIQISDGNLSCSSNTKINLNVTVSGALTLDKCEIVGNVWASGIVTLSDNGAKIDGTLTAPNLPYNYTGSGYIPLDPAAEAPIPGWVDVGYHPDDWRDSNGDPYFVRGDDEALPGCTISADNEASWLQTSTGRPIIIDALGSCDQVTLTNSTVTLPNDVVIFANGFDLTPNNQRFVSSDPAITRKLWFIVPDEVVDGQPTCGTGKLPFTAKNHPIIDQTVVAMIYSPCGVDATNGFEWHGQIYANAPSADLNAFKNNVEFTSSILGVAGVNLSTGEPLPEPKVASLDDLITIRDVGASG